MGERRNGVEWDGMTGSDRILGLAILISVVRRVSYAGNKLDAREKKSYQSNLGEISVRCMEYDSSTF